MLDLFDMAIRYNILWIPFYILQKERSRHRDCYLIAMHVTDVKDDILITCLMFTYIFQEDHFNFILKFEVTA